MSDELEELRARVKALEEAADPKPRVKFEPVRFDPTEAMRLDPGTVDRMNSVVSTGELRQIVAEQSRPTSLPSAKGGETPTIASDRGWAREVPFKSTDPLERWKTTKE